MNLKLINNSDEEKYIRFFKVNMQQEIKPWNYIEITTQSDEEKDYYETISKELGIEVEGSEPQPTWGYEKEFVNLDKFLNFTIRATKEVVDAGSGNIEILYVNTSTLENKKAVYFLPLADYVCYDQAGDLNNYGYDNTTEEGLDAFAQEIIDEMVVEDDLSILVSQHIIYTNNLGQEINIGRAELSATHTQVKDQSAPNGLELHIDNFDDIYSLLFYNNDSFILTNNEKWFNYGWTDPINEAMMESALDNITNYGLGRVVARNHYVEKDNIYAGEVYLYVQASEFDADLGYPMVYVIADNENYGYNYAIRTITSSNEAKWTLLGSPTNYDYSYEATDMNTILIQYVDNLFSNIDVAEYQSYGTGLTIYDNEDPSREIGTLSAVVPQETIYQGYGLVDISIINNIDMAPYKSIAYASMGEIAYPQGTAGWGYSTSSLSIEDVTTYLETILSQLTITSCEGPYEKIIYQDNEHLIYCEGKVDARYMSLQEGYVYLTVYNNTNDQIVTIHSTDYTDLDGAEVVPGSQWGFTTDNLQNLNTTLVDTIVQQVVNNLTIS